MCAVRAVRAVPSVRPVRACVPCGGRTQVQSPGSADTAPTVVGTDEQQEKEREEDDESAAPIDERLDMEI